MPDGEIVGAEFAAGAVGDADPADISTAPGPCRTTFFEQALVLGLGINGYGAGAAEIRQLGRRLPIRGFMNL
jgi:hypothetical protein